MSKIEILQGNSLDVLKTLPENKFQVCITSPPYWQLRNYSGNEEIGQESEPAIYVQNLVEIFREVKRVLTKDGVLWLNLGDTFAGGGGYWPNAPSNLSGSKQSTNRGAKPAARPVPPGCKPKDLIGVPWLAAFALRQDGWYLRTDVIWDKPNAFPEKVTDRPTRSHEYVFLLSKSKKYFYDAEAVKEPAADGNKRNKRSVWSICKSNYKGSHFAVFPEELVQVCLLAGSRPGDCVLDPFVGSGTTGVVAARYGRNFTGIDLNQEYCELAKIRIEKSAEEMYVLGR